MKVSQTMNVFNDMDIRNALRLKSITKLRRGRIKNIGLRLLFVILVVLTATDVIRTLFDYSTKDKLQPTEGKDDHVAMLTLKLTFQCSRIPINNFYASPERPLPTLLIK